ncbi:X-Pro dipeptidyl-peptidase C-terminal non-catalytic domain-containing protein [Colletotrichum salicis]|uniref:X-Pro dipeptidyl-peptidase C-terminal non-catalytic domain-containing protein n=1 Tax=Colletotrichum salicis TaxID=1209931 RepID=A0A135TUG8_9PEZI|nr:X-Pro dipeptidyl-peptidase C-terminal non-catalytic domain-containing protein [Colletotrichum salicis]
MATSALTHTRGVYPGDLFDELIVQHMLKGRGGIESFREMYARHPLANAWWNDKRPDMKRINVPTYITGTWTNTMRGMGAIRGWLEGDDNGWEKTPKVRMSLLRFGQKIPQAIENIVEEDFPPARTQYKEFFLSTEETLIPDAAPEETATISYDSNSSGNVSFTHTFTETTRIIGLPKAVLYMSCSDHDDMDVYVVIQKLDSDGQQMKNLNIPWKGIPVNSVEEFAPEQETEVVLYKGPVAILRATHRAIDETRSIHPHWPFHPHEKEEKIPPGEVVRLDIGIWVLGVEYEAGESLRVVVSGQSFAAQRIREFPSSNPGMSTRSFPA